MAIISFDKDAIIEYVPAYGGNRESDDPCVVRLKFIPYSRVQHYARLISAHTKGAAGNDKIAEAAQAMQKRQFVENIESISGYFIGDREVSAPAEFYETADTDLILEIIRAMESHQKLSEGQRKNS
ncbi:MAG: hypothetical protein HY890_05640 [Deltaproteobacteria bacterium]|nr:hypothetical protein [Deltaproteobacteria bacterium]